MQCYTNKRRYMVKNMLNQYFGLLDAIIFVYLSYIEHV